MSLLKSPNYFLSVWVTDACNMRCRYCFYEGSDIFQEDFKPIWMNEKTADAVIDFINDGRVSGMSFFGAEPLMHWKIVKRILARSHLPLFVKSAGIKKSAYNITTNATLLTEAIVEDIKLFEVWVNISFDGLPEQQNTWRDGSYDAVMKGLQLLSGYPKIQALKTLATPETVYEDIKHIKDVGFKRVFINLLDPFGHITYENADIKRFKKDYKRVIEELHNPPDFSVSDYTKWKDFVDPEKTPRKLSCGFIGRGLGVDAEGFFYQCHRGPTLKGREQFRVGNVFDGVDEEKLKKLRIVENSPTCLKCPLQSAKCYVNMYNKHGRFGVDPPQTFMRFEVAKLEVTAELSGWQIPRPACVPIEEKLLLATVMGKEKQYLLNPFLSSILSLDLPLPTDYVIVMDAPDTRLHLLLQKWRGGKTLSLPNPQGKFQDIKIIKMPVVQGERFMWRISRARNMVLGMARNNPDYVAYAFIDADLLTPPNALTELMAVPSGIVGALVKCRRDEREGWYNNYVRKDKGFKTVSEFTPGSILPVDATGSDCILVRREVFEGQKYEFRPEIPEAEDMGFCLRARERGIDVSIHTGVKTHHVLLDDVMVRKNE